MSSSYWSAHSHSRYSSKDALPSVEKIVAKAVELEYAALGLTDHGGMGGSAALYTECKKADISPLPGMEAYVAIDRTKGKRPKTMHLGLLATTGKGYRNLVGLNNLANVNFRWKPVLDLADLAELSDQGLLEGVVATSGCWFGMLPTLLREGDPLSARNLLLAMDGWFDQLYVELQHHNIVDETHDDPLHVAMLHGLAHDLSLPVVITQDSHYCTLEERGAHDTMKRLTSWSDDPDDALFPGDGYHMADLAWMEDRYTLGQLSDGLAGLDDLRERAKVVIPELDTFKVAVPDTGGDPDDLLLERALAGLEAFVEAGVVAVTRKKDHLARLGEESEVVAEAGMAGYLLLAAEVCDFMREAKISYNVRGSAAGSHLCWCLGITAFNTLKWQLPFDRFLSRDRTKMPDIDIDVEHTRRQEVIAWLRSKYHVAQIGTWLQMGLDADEENQKGSLLVRWKMHARKTGGNPDTPVNPAQWRDLQDLAEHKAYLGFGTHAAGLLITPDEETAAGVPLAWVASSKTMVTAFGKDDVERMGLVKLDVLGLKTLSALRVTCDELGMDWQHLPTLSDARTYSMIRQGRTMGVFQLEGGSSARGVRQMKPSKIGDLVAAMALFRPAALESGATDAFIARRSGKQPVPTRHPIIEEETKETYGVLLYQEQVLGIMKTLGLSVEEVERGRKAIKASNENVHGAREILTGLRVKIRTLAASEGLSTADQDFLDSALDAYAGYGFNRAHATSYAMLAYATAYFRANHPLEFWAGVLDAYSDSDTEVWYGDYGKRTKVKQPVAYRHEALRDGVTILGPNVNRSRISWSISRAENALRTGLTDIHGVGVVAARELVTHAPYADLSDLAMKVSTKRVTGSRALGTGHSPLSCGGAIAALSRAGALHGLEPGLALVPPTKKEKTA